MGANAARPYESREQKIQEMSMAKVGQGEAQGKEPDFKKLLRAKRDGSFIRSKEEIVHDYDNSWLPWPIRPIVKLDYCWRVTYVMWKHSFYLAAPITLCHFIW